MIEDETLYAYLDGELSPEEAQRVAAAVAADPALSVRLEMQQRLRAQLRTAFDPIADAPVPAGIAAIAGSAVVVDIGAARAERAQRRGFGLPQWAAVAAALVAGLFGGHMLAQSPVPAAIEGNRMVASAEVAAALETQLASAGASTRAVQVRLTFRNADGDVCRTFDTSTTSGVACRESDAWTIRALFAHDGPAGGTYRMAGTASAAAMTYVDAVIVGDPFDAEAERRAHQSGWAQR